MSTYVQYSTEQYSTYVLQVVLLADPDRIVQMVLSPRHSITHKYRAKMGL